MYVLIERGRRREREKNIDMTEKHRLVASHTHLTKEQTHNPGTIPDRKLNLRPFGDRDNATTI